MENTQIRPSQWAMNAGAIIGFSLAALQYLAYWMRENPGWIPFLIGFGTFAVLIVGLYLSQKYYRIKALGGFIRYDQSFVVGVLTSFYASIIIGFYYFMVYKFNPVIIDKVMEIIVLLYKQNGIGADTLKAIEDTKELTPLSRGISMMFNYTIIGIIISLITSFVVKRKDTATVENK